MSKLLEELTKSLEGTGAKFVSVEPTFHKAEEGESFDSIEIEMYFQADFQGLISYLENLESSETILGIEGVELLTEEDSSTPYVTVYFSTYISDHVRKEDLVEKAPTAFETTEAGTVVKATPSAEPFAADSRPYDQALPGNHTLSMVVWRGGKAVALIDGKVMKEDALFMKKLRRKRRSMQNKTNGCEMSWISVEERLPEKDGSFLVYGKTDNCCGMRVMLGEAWYRQEMEEFTYGERGCVCEATHWMPLPEAPKGEG